MWKLKEFRDDNFNKATDWRNAETKLLDFLDKEKPEVMHFSAFGQYGDNYTLLYKEREPID